MSESSDYSFNLIDNMNIDDGYDPIGAESHYTISSGTGGDDYINFVYGSHVQGAAGADTISFSSSAGGNDVVQFNLSSPDTADASNSNGFWKFSEDQTLRVLEEYLTSTYHSHYTSENSKVQVLDIIEAIGDGVPFCRDNLIKYASRFGKKNGMSKLDALKIMHYGVLLYHFAGFHKTNSDGYETF